MVLLRSRNVNLVKVNDCIVNLDERWNGYFVNFIQQAMEAHPAGIKITQIQMIEPGEAYIRTSGRVVPKNVPSDMYSIDD